VLLGNQEYGDCSRGSDPRVGMKGKRLLRNYPVVFQACVLGYPCKVESRFRNRPPLTMYETALSLYHIE
jgi:hypothetical protein